jgi:hypothetical protein
MSDTTLQYNVKSIRAHGLECKWSRTRHGAPIIIGRKEGIGGGRWYTLDRRLWETAQRVGILEAFDQHCALGEFFYI